MVLWSFGVYFITTKYDTDSYLSGWWCNNHLEKYEFVNGKDGNPIYEMENKKCLKPPTSY
jgi:hypothetical protein